MKSSYSMKKFILPGVICLFIFSFFEQSLAQSRQMIPAAVTEQLMHPPPVPYFLITGLCYGDTTHFFNRTTGSTKVFWSILNDKGDTLTQTHDQDMSYYFRKRGYYSICLTADNGHLATKTRIVRVDSITEADFAYRNCFNEFENMSTCADQYVWVFPDGTTSTDTLPRYAFKAPGKFPVKLTAIKSTKKQTLNKFIFIGGDSLGQPDPTFTFKHIDSTLFEFKAVDSLEHNYTWYFGDDAYDDTSGYKTRHVIDLEKYNGSVELFLTNLCGFASSELNPFAITGIKECDALTLNASVYPNPASDELTLSIADLPPGKTMLVKFIDAKGVTITETRSVTSTKNYQLKFATGSFPKGIYFIQIILEDQLLNKKIVLK
jgi:PKD repeat protein